MRLVVGAAIVRHGTVLAARRAYPDEVAGRWEFPGGKVADREPPEAALVREVEEELGLAIRVDRWLGASSVGPGIDLRVAWCTPDDPAAEPVAIEHDALRWLTPEALADVDWLEPDRPFLDEVRERLLDGEHLPGNVGGATRIGATVRRPTGPWTPAVHALLTHLARRRVPGVPAVHGFDGRGREVLDYLPGEVIDVNRDLLSERRLASLGTWMRRFHEAVADLPLAGTWRFFGVAEPTIVAHNDLAPYNLCFAGDDLAGVFDWDLAGPSTPLLELAHSAWTAIPLFRPIDPGSAAGRLRILADAYGGPSARQILDAVPVRVQLAIDGIREAVRRGDEGMRNLAARGEPEGTEANLAGLLTRLPAIAAHLGR